MKKQVLAIVSIIFIAINVNAQIAEKLLSTRNNIGYFDSISVYDNLVLTKTLNENVFIKKQNDTLYINELMIFIKKEEKVFYEEKDIYQVLYSCTDKQRNKYQLTIYYSKYISYFACLICENTNMRYGFSHNN